MARQVIAIDEAVLPYAPQAVRRVLLDWRRYQEWWGPPFRFEPLGALPETAEIGSRMRVSNGPLVSWVATLMASEPECLTLSYADGAWSGEARWKIHPSTRGTRLLFRIDLDPVPLWLKLLCLVVRPAPRHSRQMLHVFAALQRRLESLGEPRVPDPGDSRDPLAGDMV